MITDHGILIGQSGDSAIKIRGKMYASIHCNSVYLFVATKTTLTIH
jgi:hypothetical protein